MAWSKKKPPADKPRWNQDDSHTEFAGKLKEQIAQGVAPWQKPWKPGERRLPKNIQTDKAYRGGNSVYLSVTQTAKGYSDNRWATYKQMPRSRAKVWIQAWGKMDIKEARAAPGPERARAATPR